MYPTFMCNHQKSESIQEILFDSPMLICAYTYLVCFSDDCQFSHKETVPRRYSMETLQVYTADIHIRIRINHAISLEVKDH